MADLAKFKIEQPQGRPLPEEVIWTGITMTIDCKGAGIGHHRGQLTQFDLRVRRRFDSERGKQGQHLGNALGKFIRTLHGCGQGWIERRHQGVIVRCFAKGVGVHLSQAQGKTVQGGGRQHLIITQQRSHQAAMIIPHIFEEDKAQRPVPAVKARSMAGSRSHLTQKGRAGPIFEKARRVPGSGVVGIVMVCHYFFDNQRLRQIPTR